MRKRERRAPHEPDHECGAETNEGHGCTKPAGYKTDHLGQGRCWLHGGATPVKHGRYSSIKRPRISELIKQFSEETDEERLNLAPELDMLRALVLDFTERYDAATDGLIAWHASFTTGYNDAMALYMAAYANWRERWNTYQEELRVYQEAVEAAQRHYALGWPEPPETMPLPHPTMPPPDPIDYQSKPKQIIDILEVGKFLVQIGAMADRIQKQRESGTITLATLHAVLQQQGLELYHALNETVEDESLRTSILEAAESRWSTITLPANTTPKR